MISFSARSQRKNIDLPKMLNYGIKNIKGFSCGGHKRACGGQFPKQYIEKFKEYLSKIK
jgi:single-stranded DNA-specific DHH superfamily exonuclease